MSGPLFVEIHVYAKIGKKDISMNFLSLYDESQVDQPSET